MKKLIQNFIQCGLLGWCMEILFTAFGAYRRRDYKLSGVTSLWMFPIYGMAAFLLPLCKLLRGIHIWWRGLIYMLLIYAAEFTTGILLCKKGVCPWNYGHSRWNLKQVVRLDYAPGWFLSGLLFERLLLTNEKEHK